MNYQDNISFSFEYPYLAIAVVIIVPAAIILMRRLKNPFMASIPLGPPGGLPFKAPVNFRGLIKILHFLEYLGIFALFLTAAFPIIKTSKTIWLNRGADILFVIDISPSMAAIDMGGQSRIDTAKKMMVNLMQSRPSDSIGLVAVGNDAAMLIPPTSDHQAVELRLEELQLGELGDGTALGMGLAIAAYHLDKSAAPKKITVLISDGENNAELFIRIQPLKCWPARELRYG
ncbi:MAG: VWA domain-containing protein [Treponema sp.]|nr:VWA domain-containing protein [Treponema sp.]